MKLIDSAEWSINRMTILSFRPPDQLVTNGGLKVVKKKVALGGRVETECQKIGKVTFRGGARVMGPVRRGTGGRRKGQ